MSLLDTLTGGKSSEAQADLERALAAIQGVQVPTAQSMQYQIQKLVQAGVLTPEQAKTFLQSPNAMASENVPQTGTGAQVGAIEGLQSAAQEGGLNPEEQAKIAQIIQQLGTQEKGANDAVVQNQAQRGALTGGETLAAQLQGNQAADVNANQMGLGTAAEGYNAMLQELTSSGALGSGLQGQENTQANTVGAATNAINQFNAAQQQGQENYNTGASNEAQRENLATKQAVGDTNVANENAYSQYQAQLPAQVEQMQMQKAAAEAGVSESQASQATQAGGQEAGLIGGLVGTGGEVAAAGLAPTPNFNFGAPQYQGANGPIQTGAHGGEIHSYLGGGKVDGKANVGGDSPENDTVPAILSPGEVVLPRTVAHAQPDKVMEFLNRIRKPKMPHPDDTAHVLQVLGRIRGTA